MVMLIPQREQGRSEMKLDTQIHMNFLKEVRIKVWILELDSQHWAKSIPLSGIYLNFGIFWHHKPQSELDAWAIFNLLL